MKKLLFIFLSTAMISFQAQSDKFNSTIYEYEDDTSGFSVNPFNFISNSSSLIDIDFGTVADFMLFTGVGAVANTGISTITGNIGSNAGAIAGFGAPSVLNGVIEHENSVTAQAYADLEVACLQLQSLTTTIPDHSGIFGSVDGETIYPGVYGIGAAVAITGTLTLDAQGDPDAMFIFKITGALNSVAGATVLLANEASSANVFWIAVGAVGLGANTTMIGTAIAYPGAVSLGAGSSIDGKLYATVGAIATDSFEGTIPINAPSYNYLGEYTSNGVPLYLEYPSDVVSAATQEAISNSLPDNYPVPDYNPQYVTSGYDTNVKIEGNTDVWVTFVSEGVDFKNVLGFYTYDLNNPSVTAPTKDEITIIFPNVSESGSGGGLEVGDKVNIGTFEAGTGIGWVLLADAWSSTDGAIGDGLWNLYSNPDYNPESDATLRYHNVLLEDSVNERIILGFEDIKRDDISCDNDFNDAIFYVTASAYEGINTNNFADINTAYDITSGNNGGLESNGSLAYLIAKRNFNRKKEGNSLNTLKTQQVFTKMLARTKNNTSLIDYLPETGMYGTETASVSSPDDLVGITNANEVFSIDYYQNSIRVSAVFATATTGSIYDHSKVICDRLNGASLEDVRTVVTRGHQIISSKIIRATGEIEYTLSFSIKLNSRENELFSFWNIDQYPTGDYQNFQIWGNSFSQVFSIANDIIDKHTIENGLISTAVENTTPNVFVRSGAYSNGFINLNIINKTNETSIDFSGSIAETEVSSRHAINRTYPLLGNYNDVLSIDTSVLFDIGFSLQTNSNAQKDALYLADGPWGLDYLDDYATINFFDVTTSNIKYSDENYEVDRNPSISGEIKRNINLFRHILPGNQTLNVINYSFINFLITNTEPVELIIMQEEDRIWENRIRYVIPVNMTEKGFDISFADFVDRHGNSVEITNIKTVVFSIIGDDANYSPFNMAINDLSFNTQGVLGLSDVSVEKKSRLINYPNPFESTTTIRLIETSKNITIQVYDLLGRVVDTQKISTDRASKSVWYTTPKVTSGIYKYRLKDANNKVFEGTFLIK
jgi:hypothetical protein